MLWQMLPPRKNIKSGTLHKVYDFALTAPLAEIAFILDTAKLNKAAAESSFKGNYGHSLGRMLKGDSEKRMMETVRFRVFFRIHPVHVMLVWQEP